MFDKKIDSGIDTCGKLGSFCNYKWEDYWFFCRDVFQVRGDQDFLFSCRTGCGKNVACLVRDVEKILGIEPKTECGPTQTRVIWVNMSPWWYKDQLRKSFFTMMLRSGNGYDMSGDIKSILKAFNRQKYGKLTKTAIARFLSGFTEFARRPKPNPFNNGMGFGCGWGDTFAQTDTTRVNNLLK